MAESDAGVNVKEDEADAGRGRKGLSLGCRPGVGVQCCKRPYSYQLKPRGDSLDPVTEISGLNSSTQEYFGGSVCLFP